VTWIRRLPFEAIVWLMGLTYLAFRNPDSAPHFSLCPLRNAGWDFCPGCGLGESITLLFHGEFALSLATHPLGILAVSILSYRIITLFNQFKKNYGKDH
jgi:hypothetical protein